MLGSMIAPALENHNLFKINDDQSSFSPIRFLLTVVTIC